MVIENIGVFVAGQLFLGGPLGMQSALQEVCPIAIDDLDRVGEAAVCVQTSFLKAGIAISGLNDAVDMFVDGRRFKRAWQTRDSLYAMAKVFAAVPPELYCYHAEQASQKFYVRVRKSGSDFMTTAPAPKGETSVNMEAILTDALQKKDTHAAHLLISISRDEKMRSCLKTEHVDAVLAEALVNNAMAFVALEWTRSVPHLFEPRYLPLLRALCDAKNNQDPLDRLRQGNPNLFSPPRPTFVS